MAYRSTQNRWFVRCHFDGLRWEFESCKDSMPSADHVAASLRYAADMIDYFSKKRAELPAYPKEQGAPGAPAVRPEIDT